MRRRNPQENNNMAPSTDYSSVSQDPEDPSTKRGKSILPRSYNTRRRLSVLAICVLSGLALFAAVRLFQNRESSKGKVIFIIDLSLSPFSAAVWPFLLARHETYFRAEFCSKNTFQATSCFTIVVNFIYCAIFRHETAFFVRQEAP